MFETMFRQTAWAKGLSPQKLGPLFSKIETQYEKELQIGHRVFPAPELVFRALEELEPNQVRVLILGQDPYPTPGLAMGVAFAVPKDTRPLPPSLVHIIRELDPRAETFDSELQSWRKHGVLLLNTSLTVREGSPASHSKWGWSELVRLCLGQLQGPTQRVAMLWGQHAQGFQDGLNPSAVHLLKSAHPSPLSAHRGFFGNKHFELANEFFQNVGSPTIPWKDVILSYRK